VEVFFRTERVVEHSPLLNSIETNMEKARLQSFAEALCLLRF
jgi:hypothetical protein